MRGPITSVASNLEIINRRIAAAAARCERRSEEITLIAVSKTFPPEAIREAHAAGVTHFGENRIQEWEAKRAALGDLTATWHFIGHLQSNKARRAVHLFNRIDSVDAISLARRIDAVAAEEKKRIPVLIEVRSGDEPSKSGVSESDLFPLAEAAISLPHLELRGLMTIPPYFEEAEQARPYFRKLRELRDALGKLLNAPIPVLSMGMSHDFEVAIEEGATEIRVGTALFGERYGQD